MNRLGRRIMHAFVERIGDDPDRRRRATILVTAAVSVGLASPVFSLTFYVGGMAPVAVAALSPMLTMLLTLSVLRTGRLEAAGHVFVGLFLCSLQLVNLANGGALSVVLWWTLMTPIIAAGIVGVRQSRIWLVVTIASFLVGTMLPLAGWDMAGEFPAWVQPVSVGFGGALLAATMFLMAWHTEQFNLRMHGLLSEEERLAREAHERVQLVLDNVGQGFCVLDREGIVQPGQSSVLESWLGEGLTGRAWSDVMGQQEPRVRAWFSLGWATLLEDVMPAELCLAQLPCELAVGGRELRMTYQQVAASDQRGRGPRESDQLSVVVCVADVTERLQVEAAEREQRELAAVMHRLAADPAGLFAFLEEAETLLAGLGPEWSRHQQLRALHTLKGNVAMFGLVRMSALCHEVEQNMLDGSCAASDHDRQRLVDQWQTIRSSLGPLIDAVDPTALTIPRSSYDLLLSRLAGGEVAGAVRQVHGWGLQSVQHALERLAEQARHLAERLGKGGIAVQVDANGLRVDDAEWSPLWASLVHVLRNAIDHGIEPADERVAAGKPGHGRLTLTARQTPEGWAVSVRDDGRGIDWDAIAGKAAQLGLPTDDLSAVLFADGVSSRDSATEISGRGVGMAALHAVIRERSGAVVIDSVTGEGTVFDLRFPRPRQMAVDDMMDHATPAGMFQQRRTALDPV